MPSASGSSDCSAARLGRSGPPVVLRSKRAVATRATSVASDVRNARATLCSPFHTKQGRPGGVSPLPLVPYHSRASVLLSCVGPCRSGLALSLPYGSANTTPQPLIGRLLSSSVYAGHAITMISPTLFFWRALIGRSGPASAEHLLSRWGSASLRYVADHGFFFSRALIVLLHRSQLLQQSTYWVRAAPQAQG